MTRLVALGELPPGEVDVVIRGLPAAIEAGTLRAALDGGSEVGSARAVVAVDAEWVPCDVRGER